MIKDKLENIKYYNNLSLNLKKGFDWLTNTDFDKIPDGHYEIDGCEVFANIQSYQTKLDAKYEAHRKYIDIQYMIDGSEKIGVTALSNCKTFIEYDNNKDLEFLEIKTAEEYLRLETGEFLTCIFKVFSKFIIKVNTFLPC